MHSVLDKVLDSLKAQYGNDTYLSFDSEKTWFPREPFQVTIHWKDRFAEKDMKREFRGNSFGQAISKLESWVHGSSNQSSLRS